MLVNMVVMVVGEGAVMVMIDGGGGDDGKWCRVVMGRSKRVGIGGKERRRDAIISNLSL